MRLHLGYVPLCDAAPVIVAHELGFARAEGLDLDLTAEPSWATLRDRLALGHLDAAHMLAPLALASALGLSGPPARLRVPLSLSLNGNAITLTRALWAEMAPDSDGLDDVARAFAAAVRARLAAGRGVTLGTVHPFSSHTYQVRLFAERGGLDPAAIRLVAVPPQHSVEALSRGLVDGFCAGAPWNGVAVAAGIGRIAALGCEIAPDSPEKVLAVSDRLDGATLPLVRAAARAALWCAEAGNRSELAHCLARRSYLGLDAELIARTLEGDIGLDGSRRRHAPGYLRLGAPALAPDPDHVRWLVAQMAAAGQIPPGPDLLPAALALYRDDLFADARTGT
ncbi:CmpA/NrtA family ABC transporter substrate-binding protein [Methylobacterium dankookense]|uniref:Nitrate transport protein NrtA n=1 Tax=Methylobacterium dankookense TaxID=560405 RepID=A0A564G3V5_9HYPH|nr:CmpA/NrtA family ABC transporter substrate-binding protein [Methylobacterium dankookense]GJD56822.1 Nitrate/nitrite binding protein NrtA [Methylobacterium dankookense]VUF14977.1 Nitrate transport protein NrtA [Methylobacterium dankookense]